MISNVHYTVHGLGWFMAILAAGIHLMLQMVESWVETLHEFERRALSMHEVFVGVLPVRLPPSPPVMMVISFSRG